MMVADCLPDAILTHLLKLQLFGENNSRQSMQVEGKVLVFQRQTKELGIYFIYLLCRLCCASLRDVLKAEAESLKQTASGHNTLRQDRVHNMYNVFHKKALKSLSVVYTIRGLHHPEDLHISHAQKSKHHIIKHIGGTEFKLWC